jgi:hypothetical protein
VSSLSKSACEMRNPLPLASQVTALLSVFRLADSKTLVAGFNAAHSSVCTSTGQRVAPAVTIGPQGVIALYDIAQVDKSLWKSAAKLIPYASPTHPATAVIKGVLQKLAIPVGGASFVTAIPDIYRPRSSAASAGSASAGAGGSAGGAAAAVAMGGSSSSSSSSGLVPAAGSASSAGLGSKRGPSGDSKGQSGNAAKKAKIQQEEGEDDDDDEEDDDSEADDLGAAAAKKGAGSSSSSSAAAGATGAGVASRLSKSLKQLEADMMAAAEAKVAEKHAAALMEVKQQYQAKLEVEKKEIEAKSTKQSWKKQRR